MITGSFDAVTEAILRPELMHDPLPEKRPICLFTFVESNFERVQREFPCRLLTYAPTCRQKLPVLDVEYKGEHYALFLTLSTASSCGNLLEELRVMLGIEKLIMFGSCGALDAELTAGRLVVPDRAYRDEGLSYHYAPAADYIRVKNADYVAARFQEWGIPHVRGGTWTTDGLYRETRANMEKRRAEGCLAVEMEVSAIQAVCDYRGMELYNFLLCGDLLDAPEWDERILNQPGEADVQWQSLLIALELARSLRG